MRKTLIFCFVTILSLVLTYGFADAKVSGRCDSCHTMHNSQNGAAMTYDGLGPYAYLLMGNCLGCHAQNTSANIVNTIPQVLHTGTDLAGGNFRYSSDSHNRVHNVSGVVAAQDGILGNSPPGYNSGYDPAATDFNTGSRLSCAGQNGCHGNRDTADQNAAVFGGHHANDAALKFGGIVEASQGGSVGTSYRFLYKVKGGENTSWANTNANSHNEYKAATFAARTTQTWNDINTISELCAECHGDFHASGASGIGSASPWLRHPTDALIPGTGEYNSITTTYNVETPIGRADSLNTYGSPKATMAAGGNDMVICLSCHSAHGTNYPDILRWNYTVSMGAGTGCLRCHTGKDAY